MKLKKIFVFLALLLFCAGTVPKMTARAEEMRKTELFLPGSYEQYLPLPGPPSDIAVSERYFAVATGNLIYLYDRSGETEEYRVYRHHEGSSALISISKLQFTEDGRLYFADSAQQLYRLDPVSLTTGAPLLALSTFYIANGSLYAVTVSSSGTTLYQLDMNGPLSIQNAKRSYPLSASPVSPAMSFAGDTLYCAVSGIMHSFYSDLGQKSSFLLDKNFSYQLETASVCATGGKIFYSDTRGLLCTDENGNSHEVYGGSGFGALTACGDKLYAAKGATVRELAVGEEVYTGFELAGGSDSINRLSGAKDTVRAKDLLVIADCGNARTVVYNAKKQEFTSLSYGVPTCVGTDGEIIAVGAGKSVFLFREGETTPFYTQETETDVVDVAVIFGKCYYVTLHSYGIAERGAQEFLREDTPVALASDLYGNLYAADVYGKVRKYTEREFIDPNSEGTLVTETWSLPSNDCSLRADFRGNLYYIKDNAIWCNGVQISPAAGADLVFHGDQAPSELLSFALSFEDRGLYLQYGEYVVYTDSVDFPNLDQIGTGELYGEVFREHAADELAYVDVEAGSAGILVDLKELTAASEFFAYSSYRRAERGGRGVLLAEAEDFCLVALYEDYGYTVALYPAESCSRTEISVREITPAKYYVSNEVAFSYYPCLNDSLEQERLERGTPVTALAEVDAGNSFEFAFVETADGRRGYVPLSYLVESSPVVPPAEKYTLGYLKANSKGTVLYREDDRSVKITVYERIHVKIYPEEDNSQLCRVYFTDEAGTYGEQGAVYTATVRTNAIRRGNPNAMRTSVIIILSVVAVGIVAAYALLVSHKKKK